MRSDILRTYKDVHSWVGIASGLALFIAFYAGAITMFEAPLQRWASPPLENVALTPLERTPELIEKVTARYPDAARGYQIVLAPTRQYPARMSWQTHNPSAHDHDTPKHMHAELEPDGDLRVFASGASPIGQLIDDLHRKVGLPFGHAIAMPITGAIALLYGIALVSGVIVLLPTLVKDLFALRQGKNLKRMWLDFHNLLGFFSLPFHILMAVTAVVFALHDPFYGAQIATVYRGERGFVAPADRGPERTRSENDDTMLTPDQLVRRLAEQAPGFQPRILDVRVSPQRGPMLRVFGDDPAYGMRSPLGGVAGVDPATGDIVLTDYMPGMQRPVGATITSFFTLHFGSFGGTPIRWSYFLLGLAGSVLFYTGNLLWIERRRTKARSGFPTADVEQARSSRVMGALTVGISLGCVTGISLTIAAAKILALLTDHPETLHTTVYYLAFTCAIAWAFHRGTARAAREIALAAAVATLLIPVTSLLAWIFPGFAWVHLDRSLLVDGVAVLGACALLLIARRTSKRIRRAPRDSIWYAGAETRTALAPTPEQLSSSSCGALAAATGSAMSDPATHVDHDHLRGDDACRSSKDA